MNAAKKSLPLHTFGMLVRATRQQKGLTQQLAAAGAGVSRKQWALLEQGHNASAQFMKKVAVYLGLRVIPLGDGLEATLHPGSVDVTALFELADELISQSTTLGERLRSFALEAAMPPSEWSADAFAIGGLLGARSDQEVAQHGAELSRTIQNLAGEGVPKRPPSSGDVAPAVVRRKRGSKSRG